MTYHLAALRLHSIGERSARFTDVTLDFTSPHGIVATPDDSIVWLRNGGGKSSLLSLFYALMLPRATDFMGRAVKRSLTDYVDSGDTSHTVAVWHPATAQTLDGRPDHVLVTGVVYEWVDLRRPADADRARDKLDTTFYAFYAVPGVIDLERLPILDETGAPRRRATFITKLKEAAAAHPQAMDLVTTERQHDWTTQLANRGVDPSLFRTQKQMNHVEGGVDELFKFSSAREFIDLLIDLTVSPDDATNVAERLSSIASLLATKPGREAERAFCLDAATGLERVTVAHQDMDDSKITLDRAITEGATLAAAFGTTVTEARAQQEGLAEHKAGAEARKSAAETERGVAYDLVYLYEKRAAELRIDDARGQFDKADLAVIEAGALVAAWEATEHLAARAEAEQALDVTRREAEAERAQSAPQRREHDEHTARLRLRLMGLAEEHDARGRTADEDATTAAEEREGHLRAVANARSAASAADKDIAGARADLERLAADLRTAVRDGALPTETTDPVAHDTDLKVQLERFDSVLGEIRERRDQRPSLRAELINKIAGHTVDRTRLDSDRSTLASERETLTRRADELAATRRIQDLIEATDDSPVNLWAETDTLTRRLSNAIVDVDVELVRLEAEHLDDKRTLDAHTRTGLLPTTLDADRVRTTLAEHGITAETGWQHLRTLLPESRLAEALTDPHISRIGIGVVIPTEQHQAAVTVLASIDATTTALVGVYTSQAASAIATHSQQAAATENPGPAWTGLHRGLIDASSTNTTIRQVTARTEAHTAKQADLTEARAADRGLLAAVTSFIEACPADHLPALTRRINDLDQAITAHETALSKTQQALDELNRAEAEDGVLQDTTQTEITRIEKVRTRLASLADRTAAAATWRDDLHDAESRQAAATELAQKLEERANAAFETATRSKLLADGEQKAAGNLRTETGSLIYLDIEPTVDDDLETPLEALRKRYHDARRAWEIQAATSVLAEREKTLTETIAKENAALTRIPPQTQAHAAELLRTTDGQTAQQRSAALIAARVSERDAIDQRGRATSDIERHTSALATVAKRRADPPRRALPTEPSSAEHADALAAEQEQIGQSTGERRSEAERELADLEKKHTELNGTISFFDLLTDGLPEPDPDGAAAFTGNTAQAQERKRDITARIRTAEQSSAEAAATRTKAVAALRSLGAKYPNVATPAKDRVLHDAEETLAKNAQQLATQLALRADMIDGELAGIAKDQAIVTGSLARLVANTLDTLRKAERYSRVNTKTGGWAGKQMLRIAFDSPASDADLRTYVNRVIERRVTQGVKPEGLPLLKEAVHEAVGPRGFTVKALKPARDTVATTEDISRLGKWSGGEKLTVCVALYCTIAALRAANAGRKDRSGGVLLLDNPIGRASHGDLVRLQRAVAAAHKVQLLYTTGVKDPNAISLFPNVIRLDNRPGRTHNRRYIVPDTSAATSDATTGYITGARVAHDETATTDGETP